MENKQKTLLLVGLLVLLGVVVWFNFGRAKKEKPPPTVSGYYSGPMRNKSDPTKYTTEDNRVVPTPPGASNAASWAPVTVDKSGRIREGD